MAISPIEACDLIRFADVMAERLAATCAEVSRKRGLEREKVWLQIAVDVLDDARKPAVGLLDRARALPELAELRDEFAAALQNAWIDALEKLVAGITFHVSGRSPIIEALFPHQKFQPLRKAPREVLEKFHGDFQKRLKSGYVSRMLATEDFAFAKPVLELIEKTWSDYQQCLSGDTGSPEELAAARAALIEAGERVELALRQSKLLAEAALSPLPGAFETSGLAQKLKKRAGRPVAAVGLEAAPAAELEKVDGPGHGEDLGDADAQAASAAEGEPAAEAPGVAAASDEAASPPAPVASAPEEAAPAVAAEAAPVEETSPAPAAAEKPAKKRKAKSEPRGEAP